MNIRPLSKRSVPRQGQSKKVLKKHSVYEIHEHFEVLFSTEIGRKWLLGKWSILSRTLILVFCLISNNYAAEGAPLKIGVERFEPPFVIQGARNEISGFDIDMMNSLCKIMNRNCLFQIMPFNTLFPALQNKKIDISISAIIITAERAKIVNFSLPYALSYSRFLTNRPNQVTEPFDPRSSLKGKKIGVQAGTIFKEEAQGMHIEDVEIIEYPKITDVVESLIEKKVNYILVDNATAIYWEANSSGGVKTIGQPSQYGYGYGIAVRPDEPNVLHDINKALLQFQNTKEYNSLYNKYLNSF